MYKKNKKPVVPVKKTIVKRKEEEKPLEQVELAISQITQFLKKSKDNGNA